MSIEQSNDITEEWRLYMYLLRCAIREEALDEETLGKYRSVESGRLRKRASENAQTFLMGKMIDAYAQFCEEETQKSNYLARTVYEYEKYKCIRNVLALAKENQVPFVIFKGCVLANLYPQYVQRSSSDTDIFVERAYKKQAVDLIVSAGYTIDEEHSKNEVCVLRSQSGVHTIELHTCLWEDYTGRRLDILEGMKLTDTDKLIELETCGFTVTTLGYEEHLIYQLFHIIKHFSLEGIGVKYLADITLYVDAYGKYIDFDGLWEKLDRLDYARFAYYLFVICIEFLGMDDRILENRQMVMGDELLEFMLDLFNGGAIVGEKKDSWQILGMMTPYFTGEKKAVKGRIRRKLAVIFPRARDLQDHYDYARKNHFLLPVAWIHKMVNYLVKYRKMGNDWYSAGEKLDVAEHRIDLMDKLGLLG